MLTSLTTYIKESFQELKNKVTWPTWVEAQKTTVTVATFSILFALAIWGIDILISKVLDVYFNSINA